MLHTIVFCLCTWHQIGVFGDPDKVKSVSVMEGENITLHALQVSDMQSVYQILWRFGSQETLIAQIHREDNTISIYDDVHDGMFRHRLHVDNQTGSLTITNITTQHSGLYQLTIIVLTRTETSYRFNVTVYAHLPVPVISSNSSSSSKCSVLCSVLNVSHVSLSWYKGNSLLSSISVSDLNIRLSLHLEVEYQDTNTYRCVINNPITNQTTQLNINDVCQCSVGGLHSGYKALICVIVSVITAAAVGIYCQYKMGKPNQNSQPAGEEPYSNYGLMEVIVDVNSTSSEKQQCLLKTPEHLPL